MKIATSSGLMIEVIGIRHIYNLLKDIIYIFYKVSETCSETFDGEGYGYYTS